MRWWRKRSTPRPGIAAGLPHEAAAAVGGQGAAASAAELPSPVVAVLGAVQAMNPKPPVTIALIAVMYVVHVQQSRTPSLVAAFSMCPDRVIVGRELSRMLTAPLFHMDEWHLYQNMLSFLWKGYHLEKTLGSARFALLLLGLVLLSQSLVIATAYLLSRYMYFMGGAIYECCIGFSGIICALKVILNHNAETYTNMHNVAVPTKHAAWIELLSMYIFVPKLPLTTQFCGLAAGYVYAISPPAEDVLRGMSSIYASALEATGLKRRSRLRRWADSAKAIWHPVTRAFRRRRD